MEPESDVVPAVVLTRGINGLGVVRGLTMHAIPVSIITDLPDDPVLYSRYPVKKFVIENCSEKDSAILNILESNFTQKKHFLLGTSDEFIEFMNRNREILAEKFYFLLPPDNLITTLLDKSLEIEFVKSAGIPLPQTISPLPFHFDFLGKIRFPIIIKPLLFKHMEIIGKKNLIISSMENLEEFYAKYQGNVQFFLAQEVIPGGDDSLWVCNSTFDHESKMIQAFTFKRYRTSPPHFGVTSYAVSKVNPQILSMAEKLGKRFKYVGPAMFEFKFDYRDNEFKYIEINPRLGMCNIFDTRCGVNNVYSTYLIAIGKGVGIQNVKQLDDAIYINFFDDFICRIKDKEPILEILKHYFSNVTHKHVHAHWFWKDPLPAYKALKETSKRLLRLLK
jgi:predicted ATP-grasp superfamily ATP-dependent carboligase